MVAELPNRIFHYTGNVSEIWVPFFHFFVCHDFSCKFMHAYFSFDIPRLPLIPWSTQVDYLFDQFSGMTYSVNSNVTKTTTPTASYRHSANHNRHYTTSNLQVTYL